MSAKGSPPASMAWLQALREPTLVLSWSTAEWERVVRLARRLRLLARLAEGLASSGLMDAAPAPARRHLLAEARLSCWRLQAMRWTIERVESALVGEPYPRVLLKGAAYLGQGLQIAAGRLPSDLDILVPQAHIAAALSRLQAAGWSALEMDEHDQRYYREWSHEVPPMQHPLHSIELDLHHNILPPVARTRVDAELLLERLQPSNWTGWQVLTPTDQVLHSAAHLFQDSELRDRVRDLVDLDGLLRHFGTRPDFWGALPGRAQSLGLTEPLALACHFCSEWLGTPVPKDAMSSIRAMGPGTLRRSWLHAILSSTLTPTEPDATPSQSQDLASTALLVRYHLNRMPLRLLLPHLWHKWQSTPRT